MRRRHDGRGADQHGALQRRRKGVRHGVGVQSRHWRVQVVKGQFIHGLAQLGAHAAHGPAFVGHEQAPGFLDAGRHGIDVERLDRAQVDDFAGNTLGLQLFSRLQGQQYDLTSRGDGQIGPRARHARHAKGHHMVAHRHLALGREQGFGLEHQHRITGAQGGFHQTLGIGRIGRQAHNQSRHMRPHRVVHAAVVRPGRAHRASAGANHHRRLHLTVAHVAQFSRLQDDLAGRLEQEVGKHQVGHAARTGGRCAQTHAGEAEFGDRRVDHAFGAEFLVQALGVGEGATALARALAQVHDQRVAAHLLGQAVAYRI